MFCICLIHLNHDLILAEILPSFFLFVFIFLNGILYLDYPHWSFLIPESCLHWHMVSRVIQISYPHIPCLAIQEEYSIMLTSTCNEHQG